MFAVRWKGLIVCAACQSLSPKSSEASYRLLDEDNSLRTILGRFDGAIGGVSNGRALVPVYSTEADEDPANT